MNAVITTVEEVTPDWLTATLSRHRYLLKGQVQSLTVTRIHTEQAHSISYFLAVEYTPDTSLVGVPRRLYLKLPKPDANPHNFVQGAEREICLYQTFMSTRHSLPIIPCYDAVYDPHQQKYHLLLDDLSATHDQPTWHLTIAEHYITQTVESLAAFHVYWWENTDLNTNISELPSTTSLKQEVIQFQERYPRFLEQWGDQLSSDDRRIYEGLLGALSTFWEWRKVLKNQTLIHGDAHFWNFLYPLDPKRHRTYLLDWQTYRMSRGTDDVAHAIVLRYPHRTLANERSLVQRYYKGLYRYGVTDYSWEQCWYDYRRSATEQLLATLMIERPSNSIYIRRALAGFRDLACDEFFHSAREQDW